LSTYLTIDLLVLAIPFLLSFDKKVAFYRNWKYVFPAILLTGIFFVTWDILFTHLKVWNFNPHHLTGIYVFGLPVEECLFFIVIPYSSLFSYEVIRTYLRVHKAVFRKYNAIISYIFIFVFIVLALLNLNKIYTSVVFLLTGFYLFILIRFVRAAYLGWFYISYAILLIPFILVNGILTGTALANPVVMYRPSEIMGIYIFTIPVEDIAYGMLLILMNISLFEKFRE